MRGKHVTKIKSELEHMWQRIHVILCGPSKQYGIMKTSTWMWWLLESLMMARAEPTFGNKIEKIELYLGQQLQRDKVKERHDYIVFLKF